MCYPGVVGQESACLVAAARESGRLAALLMEGLGRVTLLCPVGVLLGGHRCLLSPTALRFSNLESRQRQGCGAGSQGALLWLVCGPAVKVWVQGSLGSEGRGSGSQTWAPGVWRQPWPVQTPSSASGRGLSSVFQCLALPELLLSSPTGRTLASCSPQAWLFLAFPVAVLPALCFGGGESVGQHVGHSLAWWRCSRCPAPCTAPTWALWTQDPTRLSSISMFH